jgi:hypothetical protein
METGMRILEATTFALSLGIAAAGLAGASAYAQDGTASVDLSNFADQIEDLDGIDDPSSIEVPLGLAKQACGQTDLKAGDEACDATSLPQGLSRYLASHYGGESAEDGDDHGNGGNGSANANSASSLAPGHSEQPASEAAPGHNQPANESAPGQMKKDADSGASSDSAAPGNSGNAPGHNK